MTGSPLAPRWGRGSGFRGCRPSPSCPSARHPTAGRLRVSAPNLVMGCPTSSTHYCLLPSMMRRRHTLFLARFRCNADPDRRAVDDRWRNAGEWGLWKDGRWEVRKDTWQPGDSPQLATDGRNAYADLNAVGATARCTERMAYSKSLRGCCFALHAGAPPVGSPLNDGAFAGRGRGFTVGRGRGVKRKA